MMLLLTCNCIVRLAYSLPVTINYNFQVHFVDFLPRIGKLVVQISIKHLQPYSIPQWFSQFEKCSSVACERPYLQEAGCDLVNQIIPITIRRLLFAHRTVQ